jgi:hypothetical protein
VIIPDRDIVSTSMCGYTLRWLVNPGGQTQKIVCGEDASCQSSTACNPVLTGASWQIRIVEEFSPAFSAGISIEAPAAIISASTATLPLGLRGAFASGSLVNGVIVNFNNVGPGSGFLTGTSFTNDVAPDVIGKLAWDPGWGHYEVFGVQRFFSDNVLSCFPISCVTGSITVTGAASQKITYGEGVGGSVLLPVISKYLDFTGNVMYGRGIGRYGAGQLPDATIASDGSLSPLTELTAMVGLVAHPWEGLGRLAVGAQWEIIRRDSFAGIGGAPSTNENIVLTSLRYYPF